MLYARLVPWRFGLLTIHFVSLVLYFFTKYEGIQATLPPRTHSASSRSWNGTHWESHGLADRHINEHYRDALRRVDVVLWWGYLCHAFQFGGLASALSLGWPRLTLFHVWSNAVGAVWTFWAQLDGWTFVAAEYQFALCVFAPAFCEAAVCCYEARRLYAERRLYRVSAPPAALTLRTRGRAEISYAALADSPRRGRGAATTREILYGPRGLSTSWPRRGRRDPRHPMRPSRTIRVVAAAPPPRPPRIPPQNNTSQVRSS